MTKKTVFISLILCIFGIFSLANIIESTPVGPGVMYYHDFRAAGPWHMYVLEIDLTNEWIDIETVKSGDVMSAYEKTSSMAKRKDREEHRIVGAVNGDFYSSGGIPINAQVLQGELLRRPIDREAFGVSDTKEPFAGIYSFSGYTVSKSDSVANIQGVNESRGADKLIVYNHYFGSSTGTNQYGTEIIAEYITEPIVNDTVYLKVTAKDSIITSGHGNNIIPGNGIVLSGHGISATYLNEYVYTGDTIKVVLRLTPSSKRIKELIGGGPSMITNGIASVPGGSFSTDRHPRTAVGFSQDSTLLYLFVVDGRQAGFSVGMSLYELADYMLEWGVHNGINLDGGGSSTMVVRDRVINSPSDSGGERSVANALMVVSTAPTSDLAHLQISPREVFLLIETQKQFQVSGFDQYYNGVSFQSELLYWECDTNLGVINSDGLFTAGTDTISGFVFVSLDTIRDSVSVHVTDIASIKLQPDPIILKVGEQQQVIAETKDNFGNVVDLAADRYDWSVTADIGAISESGLFNATDVGEGIIIATYGTVSGSTSVSVGVSTSIIIDNFDDINNWSISGTRVDINNCSLTLSDSIKHSIPSSAQLIYTLTTGGTSVMNMNCSIPISGTPSAIGIHVYGDGKGHWLRSEFKDNDGERFLVNFTQADPGIDWKDSWQYLEVPLEEALASWVNPSAVLNYPITWTKIYLAETDDNKKDQGVIYLDDFTAQFIQTSIQDKPTNTQAEHFHLERHFPNPFNNTTQFQIQLIDSGDITFTFYDINGKEIDKMILLNQNAGQKLIPWTPQHLPSGIYFYNIRMRSQLILGKCLLIK
ncbi:MAG: phosphodiester glycosidase family protein [Candidatus Marinimicrobia bacterium]|nr:phosphodiester glycosidase family protein [Candidatus Neomarinimicrobiota bacterium]